MKFSFVTLSDKAFIINQDREVIGQAIYLNGHYHAMSVSNAQLSMLDGHYVMAKDVPALTDNLNQLGFILEQELKFN